MRSKLRVGSLCNWVLLRLGFLQLHYLLHLELLGKPLLFNLQQHPKNDQQCKQLCLCLLKQLQLELLGKPLLFKLQQHPTYDQQCRRLCLCLLKQLHLELLGKPLLFRLQQHPTYDQQCKQLCLCLLKQLHLVLWAVCDQLRRYPLLNGRVFFGQLRLQTTVYVLLEQLLLPNQLQYQRSHWAISVSFRMRMPVRIHLELHGTCLR